jgi:hypothetical protein
MDSTRWKVRPVIFVVGLLSLFLPFVSVSCQGQTVATATGVQLATGFEANGTGASSSGFASQQSTQREGSEPMAVLALVALIAGLAFAFWHTRPSAIWSALMGLAGVFALIRLKTKIDDDVLRQGSGLFQVDYRAGFWLLCAVFVGAIGYNVYLLGSTPEPVVAPPGYETSPPY